MEALTVLDLRLYLLQRLTAIAMIPLVIGHLAVMIYAVRGGFSAAEILSRTQGSVAWFLFYELFVLAASIHAAIGLRVVAHELTGLKALPLRLFTWFVALALIALGSRAVFAVTFG